MRSTLWWWVSLIALSTVLAVACVLISTNRGIALWPDSNTYMTNEAVLRIWLTTGEWQPTDLDGHFPPGTQLTRALVGLTNLDRNIIVRLIDIVTLAGLATLTAQITWKLNQSRLLALVALIAVFVTPDIVAQYVGANSEPDFLFYVMLGTYLCLSYIENSKWHVLVFISLCFALAFLTRYAGAFLFGLGFVVIVFLRRPQTWRDRVVALVIFTVIFWLPMLAWFQSLAGADSATVRTFDFHPPSLSIVVEPMKTVVNWYLPVLIPRLVRVLLTGGLVGAIVVLAVRLYWVSDPTDSSARRQRQFYQYAFFYIGGYIAMLFLVTTFIDPLVPAGRFLVPLLPIVIISVITVLATTQAQYAWFKPAYLNIILVLWLGINGARTIQYLVDASINGTGYVTTEWLNSPTVEWVNAFSNDTTFYSNKHEQFQVVVDRNIGHMPRPIIKERDNPDYESEFEAMLQTLRETEGYLILYSSISEAEKLEQNYEFVTNHSELVLVETLDDALIYQASRVDG